MAFPTVKATASSIDDVATTSHTVTLPSGIVSGDLILVGFTVDDNPSITFPAGYTAFATFLGADSRVRTEWAYRQADGTEGATITVTTGASEKSAHNCYRISGHEIPSTQAPEASAGATGNNTSPDPDNLTPTGGAKDYLWIAVAGVDNSDASPITGFPTSYINGFQASTSTPGRVALGSAERDLNAASENPGAFTTSTGSRWGAGTIAVHPSTAPPAPPAVEGSGIAAILQEEVEL